MLPRGAGFVAEMTHESDAVVFQPSLLCRGCKNIIAKAHIVGVGAITVACQSCGIMVEFEFGFIGITSRVVEDKRRVANG